MAPEISTSPLGSLRVERLEDQDAFDAIATEWETIDRELSIRTPFTSPLWNRLWWKHFREDRSILRDLLFAHTVRNHKGELVGVAPMMLTHRPAVGPLRARTLQFFGADSNLTELCGPVCRPGYEAAVISALGDHFLSHAEEWDWLHWSGLQLAGDGYSALDRAGNVVWDREVPDYYLPLPATWEAFRSGRSRNIKEALRKCCNSLKRDGHSFTSHIVAGSDDTPEALETFFVLHAARASMTGVSVQHADVFAGPRAREFLVDYASCMAQRGALRIFQVRIGGAVVATRIGFVLGRQLYLYYSGYDPLWSRYSVMTTVVSEAIRWAIESGLSVVNLSTGNDVSKTRWNPVEAIYCYGVQVSPSWRSRLAYGAFRGVRGQAEEHSTLRQLLAVATRGARGG